MYFCFFHTRLNSLRIGTVLCIFVSLVSLTHSVNISVINDEQLFNLNTATLLCIKKIWPMEGRVLITFKNSWIVLKGRVHITLTLDVFLFLGQGIYVLQDNKFRLLTQMSAGKQYLEHASKVFNRIKDWFFIMKQVEM